MHVFGNTGKTTLEIHPTSPFVVLYGTPTEARPTELTGTLICTNSEPMPVKAIRVSLVGTRKVQWYTSQSSATTQHVSRKWQHFKQDVNLYPTEGLKHRIGAGRHEWNFRFEIPGDTDESVEGLSLAYVVYNLNAVIERGTLAKDLSATRHIRIVRTLGQDAMEMGPLEQINEDIWPDKIAYQISVPQKHYIIGTPITADFTLVPLKKGVTIGKIKMEVIEHMTLSNDYGNTTQTKCVREHVVATDEKPMPEGSERRVTPEMEAMGGAEALFDECYQFKMSLDTPKSLKHIRQTVDSDHIRLVHKLRLYVNLRNPEGHTSQLLVKNALHLFISPNLPPNDDHSLALDPNVLAISAAVQEDSQNAPPTYGRHQLDSLYREIDPFDFQSAPGSVAHTPFRGLSRNPSHENLTTSIAAITESDGPSSALLRSRLNNLRVDEDGAHSPLHSTVVHDSSGGSTPHTGVDSSVDSGPSSMTESYFPQRSIMRGLSYDMSELSRIPSYNTAVRTPPVQITSSDAVPTYDHAISNPPSPELEARSSADGVQDPIAVETRRNTAMNSRRQSPARGTSGSDDQRR